MTALLLHFGFLRNGHHHRVVPAVGGVASAPTAAGAAVVTPSSEGSSPFSAGGRPTASGPQRARNVPSASARAAALRYLRPTSFSRHLRQIDSNSRGIPGSAARGDGGGSEITRASSSLRLPE